MNGFFIVFYLSNLVNLGNKSHLDIFFSLASASVIVYDIINCFYDQDISIYDIVWGVLLRILLLLNFYNSFLILIYSVLSFIHHFMDQSLLFLIYVLICSCCWCFYLCLWLLLVFLSSSRVWVGVSVFLFYGYYWYICAPLLVLMSYSRLLLVPYYCGLAILIGLFAYLWLLLVLLLFPWLLLVLLWLRLVNVDAFLGLSLMNM